MADKSRYGDRSLYMEGGIPYMWGPGPWDEEGWDISWAAKRYSEGDLRRWRTGDPTGGGPIVAVSRDYGPSGDGVAQPGGRKLRGGGPELLSTCWCGLNPTRVPTAWVRMGRTRTCGARGCHSPEDGDHRLTQRR